LKVVVLSNGFVYQNVTELSQRLAARKRRITSVTLSLSRELQTIHRNDCGETARHLRLSTQVRVARPSLTCGVPSSIVGTEGELGVLGEEDQHLSSV
jgi:hypothetical protein